MELAGRVSRVIGDNKLIVAGVASFVMQTGGVCVFGFCKGAVVHPERPRRAVASGSRRSQLPFPH